jgi:hypothetical protein
MKQRGLTTGEAVVVISVIILFFVITIPIYNRVRSGSMEDIDIDRMRKVYVALSLYESVNEGQPAENLLGVRSYLGDNRLLISDKDPWADFQPSRNSKEGNFPLDPELPKSEERSPIRISFSYLPDFVRAGKTKIPNWRAALTNPRIGILSSGWQGSVTATGDPFVAELFGPVLRINMDGSLFRLKDRGGIGTMGDPQSLFFRR